jgi:hypothetical protein
MIPEAAVFSVPFELIKGPVRKVKRISPNAHSKLKFIELFQLFLCEELGPIGGLNLQYGPTASYALFSVYESFVFESSGPSLHLSA